MSVASTNVNDARRGAKSTRRKAKPADPAKAAEQARLAFDAEIDNALGGDHTFETEVLADAAKDQARLMGMQIVRRMLKDANMTASEAAARTGIDAATISRIATGQRASGPMLWVICALSAATGQPLTLRAGAGSGA